MHHLDLVKLSQLMDRTGGSRDLRVAVIDGPVALDHPAFAGQRVFEVDSGSKAACQSQTNIACFHGTAVVGVMVAKRGFGTPAICPDCTFLLRPIFVEESDDGDVMPAASSGRPRGGNHGLGVGRCERDQFECFSRPTIVSWRSADQIGLGPRGPARHSRGRRGWKPWDGRLFRNHAAPLGHSRRRLRSLWKADGKFQPRQFDRQARSDRARRRRRDDRIRRQARDGSSAGAPFVTGTIALLWSEFPTPRPGGSNPQ